MKTFTKCGWICVTGAFLRRLNIIIIVCRRPCKLSYLLRHSLVYPSSEWCNIEHHESCEEAAGRQAKEFLNLI